MQWVHSKIKHWLTHKQNAITSKSSRSIPLSWLITGFVTILTRRVSLVEQELLTLPDHLSSPTILSGVRVTWSLLLYVCFVNRCLSFCTFSFGHCAVCSSSIYRFGNPFGIFKLLLLVNFISFLIDSALYLNSVILTNAPNQSDYAN
jgi:hypothetical protein